MNMFTTLKAANIWGLQRLFISSETTVLSQRISVQCPAPSAGSSQPPAPLVPRDPTPSSGLREPALVCTDTHAYT